MQGLTDSSQQAPSIVGGGFPAQGQAAPQAQLTTAPGAQMTIGGTGTGEMDVKGLASGEWPPVSSADMARYQQVFQQTDADHDGKLSGSELVPVLLSLNAPKELLKDIWALADTDKDGVLNFQEFVTAIYLTERAREGRQPPSSLPPGQFPPVPQGQQPQQQQQPQVAQAPQSRGALDADLFSGGVSTSLPSISGMDTQGQQPQQQQQPQVAQAPQSRGALDADLFSGGVSTSLPSISGMDMGVGAQGGDVMGAGATPPAANTPTAAANVPVTLGISAPISETGTSGAVEAGYTFRGPADLDLSGTSGPEVDRLKSARVDAEASDKQLYAKEQISMQAKVDSATLSQKLQELVMFQRRCDANLVEAADRAERAEREVNELRQRVEQVTAAVEQVSGDLDGSNSRTAIAEAEKAKLLQRLQQLQAEQANLASGGVSHVQAALESDLQALRAQVAAAEAALGPHLDASRRASQQRMQLEAKLSELRLYAEGASGNQVPKLPTWRDWSDLEDEGFDTVKLAWGSWAREKTSSTPPPPEFQQQQQQQEEDTVASPITNVSTPPPLMQPTLTVVPEGNSSSVGGGWAAF